MKGNDLIKAIGIILVVMLVGFAGRGLANGPNEVTGSATTTTQNAASGDVQEVTLRMDGYEYVLEPSVLTKDVPVVMTVDLSTVYGCMRDVVISQFGVRKYVRDGDNVITFTPDEVGTFPIVCSMNMGRGKFSVIQAGEDKSSVSEDLTVAAPEPVVGSCGAAGTGGCGGGCGGASGAAASGGCGGSCGGSCGGAGSAGGAVGACGV